MSDIAISIKNVSKYYKLYNTPKDRFKEALSFRNKQYHKKFYATRNLNLDIKKGEVIGIVGKNGSGKSTLLKLITGVLQPDEGSIKVNGKISALLELGSGFNPEFTGLQNIFFYGTILGLTKKQMEEKLADIIAFADIGDFLNQPIKTYSSGMKSRLGFAVAVHIDPEILILDEVLAVGDILFKRKCYAKMEEFFKSGKTIIYVSHDANSIRELCNRAVFLTEGNILMDTDPKTVTNYYEKYLFSKEPDKIKQEILNLNTAKKITKKKSSNKEIIRSSSINVIENPHKETELEAYFIPDLKPKSTVVYKNYDVEITDLSIATLDGESVNVLISGEEYLYKYTVRFDIDAKDVSFGMQIKNEKGVAITASSLKDFKQEVPDIHKGETYDIAWRFTCNLLPNIYYLNAGSSSIMNGEPVFLHRIIDAICFKVISPYPKRYSGLVHLEQIPSVRKNNDKS